MSLTKNRSEYKNAIRSKKMIVNAYVELLEEKDIEKITITDIVKKADLNRGTFYRHYDYPRQIIEQIQEEVVDKMVELVNKFEYEKIIESPLNLINEVSKFIESNIVLYKRLINTNEAENFIAQLKDILTSRIFSDANIPESIKRKPETVIYTLYITGGIVTIYQAWLLDKIDCSLEDLTSAIKKIFEQTTIL